jgi:hypothetical protein
MIISWFWFVSLALGLSMGVQLGSKAVQYLLQAEQAAEEGGRTPLHGLDVSIPIFRKESPVQGGQVACCGTSDVPGVIQFSFGEGREIERPTRFKATKFFGPKIHAPEGRDAVKNGFIPLLIFPVGFERSSISLPLVFRDEAEGLVGETVIATPGEGPDVLNLDISGMKKVLKGDAAPTVGAHMTTFFPEQPFLDIRPLRVPNPTFDQGRLGPRSIPLSFFVPPTDIQSFFFAALEVSSQFHSDAIRSSMFPENCIHHLSHFSEGSCHHGVG